MNKYRLLKYLLLVVFVLPIFYGHYKFLPDKVQYLMDVVLVAYVLQNPKILMFKSTLSVIYLTYFGTIIIITILSLIIHHEGINYFMLEFRRLLYPFIFYLMFTDIFRTNPGISVKIHRLILTIFFIQIPITIFQVISYPLVMKLGLFAKDNIPFVDVASGTLGAGGHSFLGILIPLIIIYLYNLKRLKYGLLFLIPIILINSGGGMILTIIVLVLIFMHSVLTGPVAYRMKCLVGLAVFIGILFVLSSTDIFKYNIDKYVGGFIYYNTAYIEGGRETWGEDYNQVKISRFNGYKFLEKKMDKYDYEKLLGLGFGFKNNDNRPYSYKNELNYVIAERGYLGLAVLLTFICSILIYVYNMTTKMGYGLIFVKILFFVAFFLGGLYNPTTRSFQIWLLVIYFLTLLENKPQYQNLLRYLAFKKKNPKYGIGKPISKISVLTK